MFHDKARYLSKIFFSLGRKKRVVRLFVEWMADRTSIIGRLLDYLESSACFLEFYFISMRTEL